MNFELKITCPNCGYKNRKNGSQVDDKIIIKCKNCGYQITLEGDRLRAHLLGLEGTVKQRHLSEFIVTIK